MWVWFLSLTYLGLRWDYPLKLRKFGMWWTDDVLPDRYGLVMNLGAYSSGLLDFIPCRCGMDTYFPGTLWDCEMEFVEVFFRMLQESPVQLGLKII